MKIQWDELQPFAATVSLIVGILVVVRMSGGRLTQQDMGAILVITVIVWAALRTFLEIRRTRDTVTNGLRAVEKMLHDVCVKLDALNRHYSLRPEYQGTEDASSRPSAKGGEKRKVAA